MRNFRSYPCKDVVMLMTAKTIAESFKANINQLSGLRNNWSEQYANDLNSKIDDAINTKLGQDAKKELRHATAKLNAIMKPARSGLTSFKTQIETDFKKDPALKDEILSTLGFSKLHRKVQKRKQDALTQMLYTFKTNMDETLKQLIINKGMKESLINTITDYADEVKNANVIQENFKDLTKEITIGALTIFNEIYEEIIGICKNASSFYKDEPVRKAQFTFRKAMRAYKAKKKAMDAKQNGNSSDKDQPDSKPKDSGDSPSNPKP